MTALLIAAAVILGTAGAAAKWLRPAWYWLSFGALVAVVRHACSAGPRSWKPAA